MKSVPSATYGGVDRGRARATTSPSVLTWATNGSRGARRLLGDRCRGTDGVYLTVKEVAAINEQGEWPCVLERPDTGGDS